MKVLKLENLSKTFYTEIGELKVLDNINFDVSAGEIVAILGPSGAGKSTILNLISGLLSPSEGKVEVNGELGYMFQRDQLFDWRTVWNNVILGLEIKKEKDPKRKEDVRKMLEKYGLLESINNYPYELSGGMRQRIALIRTLSTKPNILLLDEPFSALDYQTRIKISDDVYNMIRAENLTGILVTHYISEATAMADRVSVLSKRPATIKRIHHIDIVDQENEKATPMFKRTNPLFQKYFDEIWRELNE